MSTQIIINLYTSSKIRIAFINGLSANTKYSKTHLSKMIQSGGFALYEVTGSVIKVLESMPKFLDIKLKNVLQKRWNFWCNKNSW